jgi:YtkA-like
MRKLVAALAVALVAVPAATAGGWATVGVAPLPPEDGSDWNVVLMVKQHGRTPLDGVKPMITISKSGSGETKSFAATPTGKPGEYRATVVFPSDGTWAYKVYDGFTRYGGAQTHTFAPVTIDGTPSGGSFPTAVVSVAVALALGLGALLALLARRRRLQPGLAATTH